jgi:uncharacterized membrane protein YjfL (UPF0719 family)
MNKTNWGLVAILVIVLGFMQMEIQTVHDDVQEIKHVHHQNAVSYELYQG